MNSKLKGGWCQYFFNRKAPMSLIVNLLLGMVSWIIWRDIFSQKLLWKISNCNCIRFLALFNFKKHHFYGVFFKIYLVMLYSSNITLFHSFPSLWRHITYLLIILMVRIVCQAQLMNSVIIYKLQDQGGGRGGVIIMAMGKPQIVK